MGLENPKRFIFRGRVCDKGFRWQIGLLYAGVFVGFLGVGVVIALMFLARFLVRQYAKDFDMEFRALLLDVLKQGIRPDDMIKDLPEQFFTKRNELGTLLGQFVLLSLVIVVVAILFLAQVITAEAGLPILSAIAGFAICKATTSAHTILPSKGSQTEQR